MGGGRPAAAARAPQRICFLRPPASGARATYKGASKLVLSPQANQVSLFCFKPKKRVVALDEELERWAFFGN